MGEFFSKKTYFILAIVYRLVAVVSPLTLDANVELTTELLSTAENNELIVTVSARTTGFIGLGFSLTGSIESADIVIAWVDDATGRGYIKDCHGVKGHSFPIEDIEENYEVLNASQNATHSVVTFSRLVNSCDTAGDVVFVDDTMRVMWTSYPTDPVLGENNWFKAEWLGPQSTRLINFENKPNVTEIHRSWDITAQQIRLPDDSASFYWCKIYKVPALEKKHHVIGYSPIIEKDHERLIEHMILYECLGNVEFETYGSHAGAQCRSESTPRDWKLCSTPVIFWASGSTGEFLPNHIGLALAEGEGKATYFMLEIHYDNPALQSIQDSSGLRLYYSPDLRFYDSSMFVTGIAPTSVQIVPPKMKSFKNTGLCDRQCTNLMFPEKGIRIVSVAFHTHSAGRAVKLRHVREGQELAVLAEDKYFDPGFQQPKRLQKEIIVLPGDDLITECTYNTVNRTSMTLGGFSMKEEICEAYVLYYPRTALGNCLSMISVDFFLDTFGIKEFYDQNLTDVENFLLQNSSKTYPKLMKKPAIPLQSLLLFKMTDNGKFNIDDSRPSASILKAIAESDSNSESILSRLVIRKPEEFQNKSVLAHLEDSPWYETLFTYRVEEILNEGKYKTFCRLQNNDPAMPPSVYIYPNYTELSRVNFSNEACSRLKQDLNGAPSAVKSSIATLLLGIALFLVY